MPEKERARLKEQYSKELRERKQVLNSLDTLRKRQSVDQALESMVDTLENTTMESADHLTSKLDAETALNEARLEIALENQTQDPVETSKISDPRSSTPTAKTIGPRLRSDDVSDRNA